MEWRFVWSRGDEHETGRALSREMLRLYRDKAREKRDVPPDIGTVFIGNNGKPMTNGCYFNISHSHGLVACAVAEVASIAGGITKNTTAKITSQHGLIYQQLAKRFGTEKAALYLQANEQALAAFRTLCAGETEVFRLGQRAACLCRAEVGDCLLCAATDAPAALKVEIVAPPEP